MTHFIQPRYSRYGKIDGYDLISVKGLRWFPTRMKAVCYAQAHGLEVYSEKAAPTAKKSRTIIYGCKTEDVGDLEADFYQRKRCQRIR